MKLTKIFHDGNRIAQFNCDGSIRTKWQRAKIFARRIVKLTIKGYMIIGAAYLIFFIGGEWSPKVTYAIEEKIVPVVIESPVLERIKKCESGGSHYGKSGQVLAVGNTNGSVDVGAYQINLSVWGKTATDMGLNLFDEADNKEFAEYLFANYGSEPWVFSKHCWNK